MTNGILLTRHNQEIAQWSPDPFPRERVGSGHKTSPRGVSLVPRPRPPRGVKGLVTFSRFLGLIKLIAFPGVIGDSQSRCRKHNLWLQHRKFLLLQRDDPALFLARKLVISSQLCNSYEFLMKPEESADCHQTLSSWMGLGTRLQGVGQAHVHSAADDVMLSEIV